MTASRDPDRLIRAFLNEGLEELPDPVYDEVRARIEQTRQRTLIGPWRTSDVNRYLKLGLAAAAVVLIAVVGYSLLPGLGVAGPGATPSPSPSVIARGSFVEHDWGQVEFVAVREGSSVTGTMTIAGNDGWGPITVDLQCTRETEDGLVLIGGYITAGNQAWSAGTPALVAIKRGSPDRANVRGGGPRDEPLPKTTGCLAYLDVWLQDTLVGFGVDQRIPNLVLAGSVEFGP